MTKVIPTEEQEMSVLTGWASVHPKLKHQFFGNLLVHVSNEGKRNVFGGKRLFTTGGCKKGFPDLFIPIPYALKKMDGSISGFKYGALFIELKRIQGSKITIDQEAWINFLNKQGYLAKVCKGAQEAMDLIEWYLGGE